nr:PREDICTED: isopentenyl-diphosphate Delta-isomerase 1 [Bemisia tabaci]
MDISRILAPLTRSWLATITPQIPSSFKMIHRTQSSLQKKVDPVQETALLEECILVDENDRALGSSTKEACHRVVNNSIPLHRAFSVFLFNSKNEMLVQQRSATKITFPNHYTNACCSHPLFEIPAEQEEKNALGVKLAAQRRLGFELGVPAEECKPEYFDYLTRIHYFSVGDGTWGEHEIDYILFLKRDVTLSPNSDEVQDVRYVKKDELDRFLAELKFPVTPWFELVCKNTLRKWWAGLDNVGQFKDEGTILRY